MSLKLSSHSIKIALAAVSALAVTGVVAPEKASAATFTENFDSFAPNTVVSGAGVFDDFVLSAGSNSISVVPFNPPGPDFSGNYIGKNPFVTTDPYRADFLISSVRKVSVTLGDFNQDADSLFVRAFNSVGTLLNETTFALPGATYGGPTLSVSSASEDIAYVLFGNSDTVFPNSVYADNFSYTVADSTAIPTPALLPGLIGLGVAALRKRKGEAAEEASEA